MCFWDVVSRVSWSHAHGNSRMVALMMPLAAAVLSTAGFWQVTDIHVDIEHECSGRTGNWFGNFDNGHFGCGVSPEAVNTTATFMAATAPDVNFIIFTGDAPLASAATPGSAGSQITCPVCPNPRAS